MPAKRLIEIDMRIHQIRVDMESGKATLQSGVELDALIQERSELIAAMSKTSEQRVQGNEKN